MKNIILIIFLLTISIVGSSQRRGAKIISSTPTKYFTGLYYGSSIVQQNAYINSQKFTSNNPTFNLGLLFEKEFNDQFKVSFRPGLMLGDVKNNLYIENKKFLYNYTFVKYELPLLFNYSIKSNKVFNGIPNYLLFGPVLNYDIANQNVNLKVFFGDYSSRVPSFVRNNETNFKFGLGYDVKLKYVNFRPEFAYSYGINILKKNTVPNINFTKIVNNQYSLNIILSQRYHKVVYQKIKKSGPPLWEKLFGKFD